MTVTSPIEHEQQSTPTKAAEWTLVACSSWLSGQEFPVLSKHQTNVVKVGRGNHCDIIFPGTHLSREHVELRIEESHIYVKDLGSVNGTFINEVRVTEGVIKPGDKLRLDVYNFTVTGPELAQTADEFSEADVNATKLRSRLDQPGAPVKPQGDSKKQWVTKPTSEGNRPASSAAEDKSSALPLYIIAGALIVAVGLLGAYLFLN